MNVLLIAGGGTLGGYAQKTLLEQGHSVDVICLEDKTSDNPRLAFFREMATLESVGRRLSEKCYDGVINFLHYRDPDLYPAWHRLLSAKTGHLIFLSSYRIYADRQHPITESAPQLIDVETDPFLFANDDYGLSKSRCERFLYNESKTDNWTVVRPVISFSQHRLDIVCCSGREVIDNALAGRKTQLPAGAEDRVAGLDWSGNTGRIIAELLFRPGVSREAYTVSSGQNRTWGQVADTYRRLIGADFEWIPAEEYAKQKGVIYMFDRAYDRTVDVSKVMKAIGRTKSDFTPLEEGIRTELALATRNGQN